MVKVSESSPSLGPPPRPKLAMIRRRSPNCQRSPSDATAGDARGRTKVTSMQRPAIAGTLDRSARHNVTRIPRRWDDVTFGSGRGARQRTRRHRPTLIAKAVPFAQAPSAGDHYVAPTRTSKESAEGYPGSRAARSASYSSEGSAATRRASVWWLRRRRWPAGKCSRRPLTPPREIAR
jgi:hypothetical protein